MIRRLALTATFLLVGHAAYAQSTATPVTPGYLTTSGCPAGYTSCFVPYGPGGQAVTPAPYVYTALGCGQLTSLGSSTLLSSVSGGIPAGATLASLSVETASVRYRDDGVAPTASVGTPLPIGLAAWPYTGPLAAMRLIQTAASAVVDVCWYK